MTHWIGRMKCNVRTGGSSEEEDRKMHNINWIA